MQHQKAIAIVGGGLAGLSAALQCIKAAAAKGASIRVTILEKCAHAGGNSFKASSGMNATTPANGDSNTLFESDTLRSGGGLSNERLVRKLVEDSEDALAFLSEAGVDLSRVSRLGGHSVPRTHSNPVGPNVGFAITNTLLGAVNKASNVEVVCNATVQEIKLEDGTVTGITYKGPTATIATPEDEKENTCTNGNSTPQGVDKEGSRTLSVNAVIIATGGFGASPKMLQEYCPGLSEYATTNGPWASGDGVKLALAAGAGLLQMEQVQLHPTGFVDPKDPDSKSKWLAPERLRGCGALLLDRGGKRFVDELQRRDVVTNNIIKLPQHQALLLMGPEASQQFGAGALEFYSSKGMMVKAEGLAAVAAAMSVPTEALQSTLDEYNSACQSGTDPFGKQYFPCEVHLETGTSYVATITPVVHYCMGGVRVGPDAGVQTAEGQPIKGLFAAGEVTGGLHGANRLGGNSLLDCVVFGRTAGSSALDWALMSESTAAEAASYPAVACGL